MFDEFENKKNQNNEEPDREMKDSTLPEGDVLYGEVTDNAAPDHAAPDHAVTDNTVINNEVPVTKAADHEPGTEPGGENSQGSMQMSDSFNYGTVEGSSYRYSNVTGENRINDTGSNTADGAENISGNTQKISGNSTQASSDSSRESVYAAYNFTEDGNSGYAGNTGNNGGKKEKTKKIKTRKSDSFGRRIAMTAAIALVFGSISGAAFQGVNMIAGSLQKDSGTQQIAQTTLDSAADAGDIIAANTTQTTTTVSDVSSVVEAVMPSVVSIINKATVSQQNMFGQSMEYESEGSGSGIIIGQNDTEMLIVTNNHVIDNANSITVTFIDEQTYDAQVKGTDANMDLAVIAVPLSDLTEDTMSQIKIAVLGDSDALTVGEPAIAIGNALGYGQSVTTGVISALNREVTVDNITNELIQTDAAINPGNSGGALLNIKGEVIGINAVKFASSDVEGMGYAIPVSSATPIINELMNKKTRVKVDEAEKGYLGIQGVDVTSEVAETYSMPMGVYVAAVVEGTAADDAGLVKGDIITAFDGNSITSMEGLQGILEYYAAGTTVDLTVERASNGGYEKETVSVTLGERTAQ